MVLVFRDDVQKKLLLSLTASVSVYKLFRVIHTLQTHSTGRSTRHSIMTNRVMYTLPLSYTQRHTHQLSIDIKFVSLILCVSRWPGKLMIIFRYCFFIFPGIVAFVKPPSHQPCSRLSHMQTHRDADRLNSGQGLATVSWLPCVRFLQTTSSRPTYIYCSLLP